MFEWLVEMGLSDEQAMVFVERGYTMDDFEGTEDVEELEYICDMIK